MATTNNFSPMQEQTQKQAYWWVVGIAVLLLGIASFRASGAYSDSVNLQYARTFAVSGDAKVTAIPDIATFQVGVITEGDTDIAKLQKDNTAKTNAILKFITSKKVAKADIKNERYSLEPRYQYAPCFRPDYEGACPPPEIVGYTISQSISVKVRDFDVIGDLLGGVVGAGANTVSQLTFTVDEPDKLQEEARQMALVEAREKAQAIAKAGGFRLGRVITIEEGYAEPYRYAMTSAAMKDSYGAPEALPSPIIEPGSQDISANVTVRYEIR